MRPFLRHRFPIKTSRFFLPVQTAYMLYYDRERKKKIVKKMARSKRYNRSVSEDLTLHRFEVYLISRFERIDRSAVTSRHPIYSQLFAYLYLYLLCAEDNLDRAIRMENRYFNRDFSIISFFFFFPNISTSDIATLSPLVK